MDEITVEATPLSVDQIRLKFHGLPNDTGPDLIMNPQTARDTIIALKACLPEFQRREIDGDAN